MRTFNLLLVVAGAALFATCSSSSSTPSDGGPGGAGGQIGTGGSGGGAALGGTNGVGGTSGTNGAGGTPALGGTNGAAGTSGMGGTSGAGGSLALCGNGLTASGGTNGLGGSGGTSGLDAAVDANCAPDPLAGCPKSPADSPCGPGAVCATNSLNGRIDFNRCIPVPIGCTSCSCIEEALLEFGTQFQNVSIASGVCSCYSGTERVDGGTQASPISAVGCSAA